MPLAWEELAAAERPLFRVANFPEWGGRLRTDVWAAMPKTTQRITPEARRAVGLRV